MRLEPGTYRLETGIANPKADRRRKADWRYLPAIPAGTQFVVEAWQGDDGRAKSAIISADAGNDWSYIPDNPHGSFAPLFAAIAPNLVRASDETRTPREVERDIRNAAKDLLAACEAAMAWIADPASFPADHVDDVANALSRAIAKARGK